MTEALYVVVKVTFGDFFMNAAMLKEQKRNKKTDKQMDNKGIPCNSKVTNYSIKVQTFRNQEVWSKDLWSNELSGPRSCRSWRPIQKICNDFYFPCKMKGMQCGESYPNVKCIQGMWRSVAICATKQLPLPLPRKFFMFDSSPLVFYTDGNDLSGHHGHPSQS